ncbi:MAG: helix-turn-helix domain-containing protein [Gammaproteobacteria bacterium]|nr:helix-turn-helix domain-containing protein [Rhodocyclaceae bacterium]MBU3908887.1 helix-turn-helix domain-containing protein [Gammaproteobacteria bacterium]MBU3987754.1 helix-turn-helix domain-containing protein [Gammaproteobacteria bacterium]MBU4003365.1 helix-turn-helix domain-containing protein [Gammaproteobacteria bacterium]MBU4021836.1 helix-turn-helix domain-containing protein [Gammaproteobacteria bacterium]
MDAIKKACDAVGSQKCLASMLGVTSGAVSQWEVGKVPIERCIEIEKATSGAVRCEELRPDVDWAYLRATNCPAEIGAGETAHEPERQASHA